MGFLKYARRGAYHWNAFSINPLKKNSWNRDRYFNCMRLFNTNNYSKSTEQKILDVGCGDGAVTYMIYKNGHCAEGIDVSQEGIDLAIKEHNKRNTNCTFLCGDIFNVPKEEYDGIICTEVIEHVKNPAEFISQLYNIVKPGGSVIISTPIRHTKVPMDEEHIEEWFSEDFQALFENYKACSFHKSHPIIVTDLYQASKYLRLLINLLGLFSRPFLWKHNFKHFFIQYAVVKKPQYSVK